MLKTPIGQHLTIINPKRLTKPITSLLIGDKPGPLVRCLSIYTHHHHYTVQVAICTLVITLVLRGKTPPAQVAVGDDYHECKWSMCTS